MAFFFLLNRKYCSGNKEVLSIRLPDTLTKTLKEEAKRRQKDLAELVMDGLDLYLQTLREDISWFPSESKTSKKDKKKR